MRGENRAAEADGVAIVEDAINVRGREVHRRICAVLKIGLAARLDDGHVGIHHIIFGAGEANDLALPAQWSYVRG